MLLQTKGIILREWQDGDVDSIVESANNKKVYDNLRDGFPHPYTKEDAKNWIEVTKKHNDPQQFFAIVFEGKPIGSIGIHPKDDIYRKNAEIGYYIAEEHWGKGIMTEAIKLVVKYAFEHFDIIRIFAEPFSKNIGSRRALEKAGFKCEAIFKNHVIKNNVILDSCIYSILVEDFEKLK